jgi:hypothetical protein
LRRGGRVLERTGARRARRGAAGGAAPLRLGLRGSRWSRRRAARPAAGHFLWRPQRARAPNPEEQPAEPAAAMGQNDLMGTAEDFADQVRPAPTHARPRGPAVLALPGLARGPAFLARLPRAPGPERPPWSWTRLGAPGGQAVWAERASSGWPGPGWGRLPRPGTRGRRAKGQCPLPFEPRVAAQGALGGGRGLGSSQGEGGALVSAAAREAPAPFSFRRAGLGVPLAVLPAPSPGWTLPRLR